MPPDLHLEPVHFYCQVYTVLEHGRYANLSVAKFTQERGATSSFNKVVKTLATVLSNENALVTNPVRQKGIKRSLKEAGI
jgi:serine/threonine-protein kinase HSL1 (negative regulator of Swe1 kinase)